MRTIIWSALLRSRVLLLVLAAGCASQPSQEVQQQQQPQQASPLAGLPATFANTPSCDDCLGITLTLRADGAYLVRERLRGSEFYDFGRWRQGKDGLLLEGGRDAPRRYGPRSQDVLDSLEGTQGGDLKRQAQVETLRGPFRVVGTYDGAAFRECRTGLAWPLGDSRPGERLKEEFAEMRAEKRLAASLVAIDGRFEAQGGREVLVVQRTASLLTGERCPG
jgi:hypothetical protein